MVSVFNIKGNIVADKPKSTRKLKTSSETIRQRAEKTTKNADKPRRVRSTVKTAGRPFHAARRFGAKEYYLPMPDNRFGRFMNKRRRVIPRYFRESWQELRRVTWPDRKETTKLTLAVFAFAVVFGLLVSVTDYGLDQLFKKFILK